MTILFEPPSEQINDLVLAPQRTQRLGSATSTYDWCRATFGEERDDADRYIRPSLRHELKGQWAYLYGRLYLTPAALTVYLLRWT